MNRRLLLIALAIATAALTVPAQARLNSRAVAALPVDVAATPAYRTDDQAKGIRQPRRAGNGALDANGTAARPSEVSYRPSRASYGEMRYLPHPAGCPMRAFCGCGAAVEIFGRAVRDLWPARAWYKFPRSAPMPGMVAVRGHHVFVLRTHIDGAMWMVADYNSGRHQSRLHVRSIAGYTIVNPSSRMASAWQ